MRYNILVVDDDPRVIESFELIGGELDNCQFFCTTNPSDATKIVNENIINLMIVDIVLPNTSGYDVCMELKKHPNSTKAYCILMSSDRNQLLDRIRAYKVGAQEFLNKPFDLKEAELIIRSKVSYFIQNEDNTKEKSENSGIFTSGKFLVSERNQQILMGDKKLELTSLEYNLLKFFILNSERFLDLNDLVKGIWSDINQTSTENVRTLIFRLRLKIEPDPKKPIYITSKKNVGYFFYPSGEPIL